jgi:two-component system NarL family response regulator
MTNRTMLGRGHSDASPGPTRPGNGRVLDVLIADERGLFRESLRLALERNRDLRVAAEAADGEAAVLAAEHTQPDVAILSVDLPGRSGIEASSTITGRVADCKTIVLASAGDEQILTDVVAGGASAYLPHDCSLSDLVDAVHAVARGETVVPPRMLGPLLTELLERRNDDDRALLRLSELSPREREVLALVVQGEKTRAIADSLVISRETARTHIQNILTKLDVHSRVEAAAFVTEHGLIDHIGGGSEISASVPASVAADPPAQSGRRTSGASALERRKYRARPLRS